MTVAVASGTACSALGNWSFERSSSSVAKQSLEKKMPDGMIAGLRNSRRASEKANSKILRSGVEMEALWTAHKTAEDLLNSSGSAHLAEHERIRSLYPKPPRAVFTYFLTAKDQRSGLIEHPAPYQEGMLLRKVEYWRSWGLASDPCKHAVGLLNSWRAWNEECETIYAREGGHRLDAEDEELESKLNSACDQFVDAPTISQLGILLKLEYVAQIEEIEEKLDENPNLALGRTILGIIADLKRELGRT